MKAVHSSKEILNSIIAQLEELQNNLNNDGICNSYIESEVTDSEQRILANTEGFIYLAQAMLGLGSKALEGSHQHVDSSSMLDKGAHEIIMTFKNGWAES